MRSRSGTALVILVLAFAGCRTAVNYPELGGPRYTGAPPVGATRDASARAVRIVSFNIERALRVESAIQVMQSHLDLRAADVILLQEMDAPGTRRVAEALGMGYVYYPGDLSLKTHRDFGNAVLSRWPVTADAKILLPHLGIVGRRQRIATAATLDVGGTPIRVYSVHLGTMINASAGARRAQLRTVLEDARGYPHVILGGDLNSHGVGREASRQGFAWPTEDGPRTTRFGRWDHIFIKGFAGADTATGTVLDVAGASDHRPVWAVAALPESPR